MDDRTRLRAKILSKRGKKSFGLIAAELGISRATVAGICFRASHPIRTAASPHSHSNNKIGTGHRSGPRARRHLPLGRPAAEARP